MKTSLSLLQRVLGSGLVCAAVLGALFLCALAPSARAEQVSYQQVTPVGFYDAVTVAQTRFFNDANDVTADGNNVFFSTFGPFPGIPDTGGRLDIFRASRGADGTWHTTWMSPGASTAFDDNQSDRFFEAASADGSKIVYTSRAQYDPSRFDCGEITESDDECYVKVYEYDSTTGQTSLISRATAQPNALFSSYFGSASPDLGTITWLTHEAMTPEVEDQNSVDVYSSSHSGPAALISAVSGSTGSVSATQQGSTDGVGQNTVLDGLQGMNVNAQPEPARDAHLVSADGNEVFFQDVRQLTAGAPGPDIQNVYMRRGSTTVLISSAAQRTLPTTVPQTVSFFDDATPDGRSVFFDTASQLTNGDNNGSLGESAAAPNGFDVYRYDVPTGEVSLVSAVGSSETSVSEGTGSYFVAASADGSHVYFASRDDLDPGSAPPGAAWKLYERVAGRTHFIALFPELELLVDRKDAQNNHRGEPTGEFFAANNIESECQDGSIVVGGQEGADSSLASGGCEAVATVRATADGSRLIFESAQRLTPDAASGLQCVTANANFFNQGSNGSGGALSGGEPGQGCNIYMYDDATGTISLLSPGASTYGAFFTRVPLQNTFGGSGERTEPLYQPLSMSSDGSRVFFSSKDALAPGAVSGLRNIYVWSNGALSLVSPPYETSEAIYDGNSADGSQVFFHSRQSLVGGVENHQQFAIYDAQLGDPPTVEPADSPTAVQPVASAPAQTLTVATAAVTTPPAVSVSAASTPPSVARVKRSGVLTRAGKLAKALKVCRAKHPKHERTVCESHARKLYGSTPKAKSKKSNGNQEGNR